MRLFPNRSGPAGFGGGLLGAGRVLAGLATALVLIGAGVAGLRTDVLGMRHWPGSANEAPRIQLLPDRVPLITRVASPLVAKAGPAGLPVVAVAQPASPTAQSTPLSSPGGQTAGSPPPDQIVVVGPTVDTAAPVAPGGAALRDSDGDGLPDSAEARLGTDPNRRDTDGDGLPDGWEVTYGLNARLDLDAVRDPDRDGVDNRNEYLVRSNPRDADTNHDGVVDGRDDSDGDGVPNAVEQQLGLDPALAATPPGRREPVRGLNTTTMPEPTPDVVVNAAKSGTPATASADDGALDADGDGVPNALEIRLGGDPTKADTDANGVSDGSEDADGDGLSNAQEVVLALDPGNADTDGDGTPDGQEDSDGDGLPNALELKLSLDPARADSDGDGVADGDIDSDADGTSNGAELSTGHDPATPDAPPAPASESPGDEPQDSPGAPPEQSSPEPEPPATAPAPPVDVAPPVVTPPVDVTPPPSDVTPPPSDVTPPPVDVPPPPARR